MTALKFEFTIEQTNAIINALNMPSQTPATTAAALIRIFHEQAEPQIAEFNKEVEKNESETASN